MSEHNSIDDLRAERIHALWDELSEFEAARHDEALEHLLRTLCELIGAINANWLSAVRLPDMAPGDPTHGWRPRCFRFLYPSAALDAMVREQMALIETHELDIHLVRGIVFTGELRARRLVDIMPPEWFHGDYYRRFYLDVGRTDAIWAGCPVNDDAEVYLGFFRGPDQPGFTVADCQTVYEALRSLRWFHRQYLLSHGLLVADTPLTTVEREVLHGLLSGMTEKQIAVDQGRSLHTTHEYVKALYRKFGVTSRAALMALWLGRMPR